LIFFDLFWESVLGMEGSTVETIRLDRLSVLLSLRSDGPMDEKGEMDLLDSLIGNVIKNSRKNGASLMDLSNGLTDKKGELALSDGLTDDVIKIQEKMAYAQR
jgi:hypothetical protein